MDQTEEITGKADQAGEVAKSFDQSFSFLSKMDFTVELGEVMIFAVLTSICLILGKHKLGLIAAYGFLFYWVFVVNQGYFMKQFEATAGGVYVYGALGMVMALVGFVGFIKKTE